jgi:AcrR family transcriptional regulator
MPRSKTGVARLTRDDWVTAGIESLEKHGFLAVRADALARRLGVSRGSFYWHFKDVAAFERALLDRWRDMVLGALDTPLAEDESRLDRFRTIMRRSLLSKRRLETAFRAWATVNPRVRSALRRVDTSRETYMARLLALPGRSPSAALALARVAYWTYLGHTASTPLPEPEIDAVVDSLLALVATS